MRALSRLCGCCLLLMVPAGSALADSPPEPAEASAGFDPRYARMDRDEALFLEGLFLLTRQMREESVAVARWLLSDGRRGTSFPHYRERADDLLRELEQLETPPRVEEVRALVGEAFRGLRDFFADWDTARKKRREFSSQLTSEFGFHHGLHATHRALLRAFERLVALFPDEDEQTLRAFQQELGALDLTAVRRR